MDTQVKLTRQNEPDVPQNSRQATCSHCFSTATQWMTTLNRDAAEIFAGSSTRALTDVTGFGLLAHLRNMMAASQVSASVFVDQVPFLPAAVEYVSAGIAPGGTHANLRFLHDHVTFHENVSREDQLLLCDAQTSGGLLAAVPAPDVELVFA